MIGKTIKGNNLINQLPLTKWTAPPKSKTQSHGLDMGTRDQEFQLVHKAADLKNNQANKTTKYLTM